MKGYTGKYPFNRLGILRHLQDKRWDLATILIYLFLSIFSFHKVLPSSGLLYQGDLTPPLSVEQAISAVKRYSSPWDSYYITGRFNPNFNSVFLLYCLLSILYYLLGSVEHGIKILLILILAGSGLSMYYAARFLTGDRKASFIAGLFYMLNPWVYDRLVSGHILFLLSYILFPPASACLIRSFESEEKAKYSIMSGVFFALLCMLQYHMAYLAFLSIFLFILISILFDFKNKTCPAINLFRDYTVNIILISATTILLNMWWLFPSLMSLSEFGATPKTTLSALLYTENRVTLTNTLRLSSYWMAFYDKCLVGIMGKYSIFHLIGGIALTIMPLTAIPLLHRNKISMYFWILALIGIILGMGTRGLGTLYVWLVQNVPLFLIFDDPNKFLFLTAFALSFLMAFLLADGNIKRCFVRIVFLNAYAIDAWSFILTLIILGNALPYYTGNFNGELMPLNIPPEIRDAANWLKRNGHGRMVLLPPHASVSFSWSKKNIVNPLLVHPPLPVIALPYTPGVQEASPQEDYVRWAFMMLYLNRTSYAGKLFSPLGARYFVLIDDARPEKRADLLWIDEDKIKSILQRQRDLKLVYHNGSVYIFENLNVLPELYAAKNATLVIGDRSVIVSLSYLRDFNFKFHPLIFIQQLAPTEIRRITRKCDFVIINPHHLYDLLFALLHERYLINIKEYVADPFATSNYAWFIKRGRAMSEPIKWACLVGNKNLSISVNVDTSGEFEVWAKIYIGPEQGSLQIRIGGLNERINSQALTEQGFRWMKIGETYLAEGEHKILIQHEGAENVISQLAIFPRGTLQRYMEEAMELLEDLNPIIILEGEEVDYGGWLVTDEGLDASNGYSLKSVRGQSAIYYFDIPKEGSYNILFRVRAHQGEKAMMSMIIDGYSFEADEIAEATVIKDENALNGYSVYRSPDDGDGVYVRLSLGKSLPPGKYDLYVRIKSMGGKKRFVNFYQINGDNGRIIRRWLKSVSLNSYGWLKVGSFNYDGTYNLTILDRSMHGLCMDMMVIMTSRGNVIQEPKLQYKILSIKGSKFNWIGTSVYLTKGRHMLDVKSNGTSIDLILIYPSSYGEINQFIEYANDKKNIVEMQGSTSIMPCMICSLQPSERLFLITLTSYGESWLASNMGSIDIPIHVWSYANAFCLELNRTKSIIKIEYDALLQHYNTGTLISVFSVILISVIFIKKTSTRLKEGQNKNIFHRSH